jgi:hypothetical protein
MNASRLVIGGVLVLVAVGITSSEPVSARFDFEDITARSGIRFSAQNGKSPEKFMIETMGSGVGVFDYDQDGKLDIVFVSGGGRPGTAAARTDRLALYKNEGAFKFTDVTAQAGLRGDFNTYGMGVAIADYDNDGNPDLLLTGFPRCVLFHNNGDGTFSDVTEAAGVGNRGNWASSAGWFDYDRDGLLDLVVANYVSDFSWDDPRLCGEAAPARRTYCHPDVYKGTGVRLYRNEGHGTFLDVTDRAGLKTAQGKCLGLVLADFDGDGRPDIFVANDGVQNFLYLNKADGAFVESGLANGIGFSEDGQTEAGMGADAADVNGDLRPDIYVSHLDNELNRLYFNTGSGRFRDATGEAGLGEERSLLSGFGVKFADFDNSGRQHLVVANGHILDNITLFHPRVQYREPVLLLEHVGCCKFRKSLPQGSAVFLAPLLGRGLATGDFDDDGLVDFVVSQNFGPPMLARNRNAAGNWITLRLQGGAKSNRDAIGAEVTISAGGRQQRAQVTGASSYCSTSDRRLHFGLGAAKIVDRIEVKWPSGRVDIIRPVTINRLLTVMERP